MSSSGSVAPGPIALATSSLVSWRVIQSTQNGRSGGGIVEGSVSIGVARATSRCWSVM